MPADAKFGLFIGICLVVVAAWVYRSGTANTPPAKPPVTAIADSVEPVLIPDRAH